MKRKTLVVPLVLTLFALVFLVAPVQAQLVTHYVQLMDEWDDPMVNVHVTFRIQTGPIFNDPLDWTELEDWTDASGTASVDADPHGNANSWWYDADEYAGPDPNPGWANYPVVAVLLDWYIN